MIKLDVLDRMKLNKGDMALDPVQLADRVQFFTNATWPWAAREREPDLYRAWIADHLETLEAAEANTVFNRRLEAYRKATARLAKYRLADGRAEVREDWLTGGLDENGDPETESVVVQTAIDPLPATVPGMDTSDPDNPFEAQVPNPQIIQDYAERAAAQAVIDSTPQEVKDWEK